jgi:hypothetical protein
MASTAGRSNHWWEPRPRPSPDELESVCRHCGLTELHTWLLDEDGRPVAGLVWLRPDSNAVAVRPFAFSKNRRPAVLPTRTWSDLYPGVPVSGTPQCPKDLSAWDAAPS